MTDWFQDIKQTFDEAADEENLGRVKVAINMLRPLIRPGVSDEEWGKVLQSVADEVARILFLPFVSLFGETESPEPWHGTPPWWLT
jgi:hypothetical protein